MAGIVWEAVFLTTSRGDYMLTWAPSVTYALINDF